jgi:hypothetical protein
VRGSPFYIIFVGFSRTTTPHLPTWCCMCVCACVRACVTDWTLYIIFPVICVPRLLISLHYAGVCYVRVCVRACVRAWLTDWLIILYNICRLFTYHDSTFLYMMLEYEVCVCVHVCVCFWVCVCLHSWVCVCVCVCACVFCVCVYVW